MQAKREKNHNNSNHAPISTFTHNKIRPLSPVLAAPRPLAATGFEAAENATAMRNGKKGADRSVCSFFQSKLLLNRSVLLVSGRSQQSADGQGDLLLLLVDAVILASTVWPSERTSSGFSMRRSAI